MEISAPPLAPDPPPYPPAVIPEAPRGDLAWLDAVLDSNALLLEEVEAGVFSSEQQEPEQEEEDDAREAASEPLSLVGVAARLEQVAASLRHRSAEELIADWRSAPTADPLEALLTGFVLGYEQGRGRRE